jgi:hypothetical protein
MRFLFLKDPTKGKSQSRNGGVLKRRLEHMARRFHLVLSPASLHKRNRMGYYNPVSTYPRKVVLTLQSVLPPSLHWFNYQSY